MWKSVLIQEIVYKNKYHMFDLHNVYNPIYNVVDYFIVLQQHKWNTGDIILTPRQL